MSIRWREFKSPTPLQTYFSEIAESVERARAVFLFASAALRVNLLPPFPESPTILISARTQVAGYEMVTMRINTMAAALQAEFTTKDLFFADLAYAPPFTPIWEPLTVSARVLKF